MISEPYKFGEYKHKHPPFKHQEAEVKDNWDKQARALFWEMGGGKSKPILDSAAMLFLAKEIDGLLIISDNGAYRNWVDYEVPIHWMEGLPVRMAYWTSTMPRADLRRAEQLLVARDDMMDVMVMNVEAFSGTGALEWAMAFLQAHYAMAVVDESTSIKTLESKRTQNILKLRDLCCYRRILTGTPITNSPMDLYAQFEFLGPGLLGETSFVSFRTKYAITMLYDMGKGKRYYKIIGYNNLAALSEVVAKHSSRLLKSECMDLPEKLYETHYVEHTPEQARVYQEVKEMAMSELDAGMVTAVSAITALTKLHQINCGHVKLDRVDDADAQEVDIPSNRITELLNLLERINDKVIIWACFRRDIELICAAIKDKYGSGIHASYWGDTDAAERKDAIAAFRSLASCKFFVSNPATGGKGITLVEANYAIYYSNSFHLERRLQSEDRIHRPGQNRNCTYIDLITWKTVDVRIVRALKNKKDLASEVLDCYRELLTD